MFLCLALGAASAATFVNGEFEDGTGNGWTTGGGIWGGEWPQVFGNYTDPAQYKGAIVTPGDDPIIGSALKFSIKALARHRKAE